MRTCDIDGCDDYTTRVYNLQKEKELVTMKFNPKGRIGSHVGQKSKEVAKRRKRNKNKKTHR